MNSFAKGFVSAIILVAICSFSGAFFPKAGTSILQDGVSFYGMRSEVSLYPFRYNEKYGFTAKHSGLTVLIEPVFDDMYNNDSALVPVEKNGKWGVVDVSGNTLPSKQPIIPCKYDIITLIDDLHVYATLAGKTEILDVRDFRNR